MRSAAATKLERAGGTTTTASTAQLLDWGTDSPAPGIINTNYFGARLTFYMQVRPDSCSRCWSCCFLHLAPASLQIKSPLLSAAVLTLPPAWPSLISPPQSQQQENVTFYLNADDAARLYINDDLVVSTSGSGSTSSAWKLIETGIYKIVITYVEWTGAARINLQVASANLTTGVLLGSAQPLGWQKVSPVPPGTQLPIEMSINGVPAVAACPQKDLQLQQPTSPLIGAEPPTASTPNGTCAFVYSTYLTPQLMAVKTLIGTLIPKGITPNSGPIPYSNVDLYANLTVPSSDMSKVKVMIDNEACNLTSLADVNVTSYTRINGAFVNFTVQKVSCSAPFLPPGTAYPVRIMVDGRGYTRSIASFLNILPETAYTTSWALTPTMPVRGVSTCLMSMYGGAAVQLVGQGGIPGVVDVARSRSMGAIFSPNPCYAMPGVLCDAINSNRTSWSATWSNGSSAEYFIKRYRTSGGPSGIAGNNTVIGSARFLPVIVNTATGAVTDNNSGKAFQIDACGGRTPNITSILPGLTVGGTDGALLNISWGFTNLGAPMVSVPLIGSASVGVVELESAGGVLIPCANGTAWLANSPNSTLYNEGLTCSLPPAVPASTYTLWLCTRPWGCGYAPTFTVPLVVSSISPTTGSSAGGTLVTITGSGFDTVLSRMNVSFGDSACRVISSNGSVLTCLTTGLPARPAAPTPLSLRLTPTLGAAMYTNNTLSFTFDPALEAVIYSLYATKDGRSPARGSTEGNTSITINGTNFALGVATTITIGDNITCNSVTVLDEGTITCLTPAPPAGVLRTPLPVTVFQEGRGVARGAVTYQYIDLWSRSTTWGGGPLPDEESLVVIPYGLTVLLDVSPPLLHTLVLEGNLIFDEATLHLQVRLTGWLWGGVA